MGVQAPVKAEAEEAVDHQGAGGQSRTGQGGVFDTVDHLDGGGQPGESLLGEAGFGQPLHQHDSTPGPLLKKNPGADEAVPAVVSPAAE